MNCLPLRVLPPISSISERFPSGVRGAPPPAAHKLLKQLAQFIGINGEGKAAVIFAARIAERHIAGINIADLLRQPDHIPVAVRADDLYHRPVRKLRKSVVIQPGARANIQLAAVGGDDSCFSGFLRANRAKRRGDQFGEIVPR